MLIQELREELKQRGQVEAQLRARIAELEAARRTTSRNSSKPPSADGPGARPRSLRRPSGRGPGGQVGHEGSTLEMTSRPDVVVEHRPWVCGGCEGALPGQGPVVAVERRQVFDLPEPIRLQVVEHQLATVACPNCAALTKADAPPGAPRQVHYGARVRALATYLVSAQHLTIQRCADLFADLFGAPISPGTITSIITGVAEQIHTSFAPAAADAIAASPIAHVDETGFTIAGRTQWVHSISTPEWTWIAPHAKRGRLATDDIAVLPRFTGILVHDAWAPYDTHADLHGHQLCCAHLLRELQAVTDNHHHTPSQWCWAEQTASALRAIIDDPTTIDTYRAHITAACAVAPTLDPDTNGKLGTKSAALRRRIQKRLDDYLRFTTRHDLPATNNPAEQEIRMVKIKQKITGGMRTLAGATAFTTIRSYLSTARKHHIGPLHALHTVTNGHTWLPTTP